MQQPSTLTITGPNSGITGYKYRCVVTNTCFSATTNGLATLTVNVLPDKPTITADGPTTFCEGGSVNLTSSSANGNIWSNAVTTQSINVTTSGSYTVQVTDGNGCQSPLSDPTVVTVNPLPAAAGTIAGASSVNPGQSVVSYSISAIPNAESYEWTYTPATGVTINGTGTTVTLDFSAGAATGTLSVHGFNTTCGAGADATLSITVNVDPFPIAYNVTGTGSYCSTGSGLAVGLDNSETGVTYELWKNGVATGTTLPGTGSSISFINQLAGTYTIKGTNVNGTTTMSGSAVITAVAPPTAYAGPAAGYATVGVPYLLSASDASSYTTLSWSHTGSGSFDNSAILHPAFTGLISFETVTLQLTATNAICPEIATSSINVTLFPPGTITAYTWTGATNTVWETTTNWSPSLPSNTQFDDIVIPSTTNKPAINSQVTCNDLSIDPGAVLTIGALKSLTVVGTLTNNAGASGLVLNSDASGTGSLLHYTPGVQATVERYITGDWSTWKTGWHQISSPVAAQAISPGFVASYVLGTEDFYKWDEPSNNWINIKNDDGTAWTSGFETNFEVGKGYLISYPGDVTNTFSGTLNVSSISKSNLSLSAGANYSWHLLGNPYSTALDWSLITLSNFAGTCKIWNETGKTYTDITTINDRIPSAQGFMVSVSSGSNSITIPSSARTIDPQAWYKSSEIQYIKLLAAEQDGSSFQENNIIINSSASPGFDFEYDSRFLAGYAPQFYSVIDNEKLSTKSLPDIKDSDVIPFGFIKNEAGSFKIELKAATTPNLEVFPYRPENKYHSKPERKPGI